MASPARGAEPQERPYYWPTSAIDSICMDLSLGLRWPSPSPWRHKSRLHGVGVVDAPDLFFESTKTGFMPLEMHFCTQAAPVPYAWRRTWSRKSSRYGMDRPPSHENGVKAKAGRQHKRYTFHGKTSRGSGNCQTSTIMTRRTGLTRGNTHDVARPRAAPGRGFWPRSRS